jgi:hypothetical protein
MKTVSSAERTDFLRQHGIDFLTGEACGIGARVLCDVSNEGAALLCDLLGVVSLNLTSAWNNRFKENAAGSIMLPHGWFEMVVVWALLRDGAIYVVSTNAGLIACNTPEEIEQLDGMEWIEKGLHWRRHGTAQGGMRNRHEFSGRVN